MASIQQWYTKWPGVSLATVAAMLLWLEPGDRPIAHARTRTGAVSGTVRVSGETSSSSIVAYLQATGPRSDIHTKSPRGSGATRASIRQRDRQFVPQLTVVPVGSEIEFPNDDRIFHNVFSLSRARRFDLGLYRSGSSRTVTFDRPGVVEVYCNIHPEMVAHVLVLDTAHYAIVGKGGKFRLQEVPAGNYDLVVWQAYGDPVRTPVVVNPGKTTHTDVPVRGSARPRRHNRKDGTPYGRYR